MENDTVGKAQKRKADGGQRRKRSASNGSAPRAGGAGGSAVSAASSAAASSSAADGVVTSSSRFHAVNPLREPVDREALLMHTDDLSSDDEVPRNTIGKVPLEWYKDYDHIGYDLSGGKVVKRATKDGIDRFLNSQDDPHARWVVYDEVNDEEVMLSKRDVQIIKRMRDGNYAHPGFDAYPEMLDLWSADVEVMPLVSGNEPKARYQPSKWEARRIARIVRLIKAGKWKKEEPKKKKDEVYLIWGDDDAAIGADAGRSRGPVALPAPKMAPPGHAFSYNPPPEYLMTEEEKEAWHAAEPADRPLSFIPRKFDSLRAVPLYAAGIRERFERCLDLYLCPRTRSKRKAVDPESLLPKLPDPSELRPFPTAKSLTFSGHTGRVRSISLDPSGQWLVSGADDNSVRLWDVATGRCVRSWDVGDVVHTVAWCPNPATAVVAVVTGSRLLLLYPGTAVAATLDSTWRALIGNDAYEARTQRVTAGKRKRETDAAARDAAAEWAQAGKGAAAAADAGDAAAEAAGEAGSDDEAEGEDGAAKAADVALRDCKWTQLIDLQSAAALLPPSPLTGGARGGAGGSSGSSWCGPMVAIEHPYPVRRVAWHKKGDYCATVMPGAPTGQVMVHQLSKRGSQCPFAKNQGAVQTAAFHPHKPLLYVANQRTVRVYNLLESELVQKLESGVKWIASLDIHPSGDHVVLGSHDCRTVWFDTELDSKPYKTLRYHAKAVRKAVFHPSYPLMATASDDGTVHIFHARVFNDFLQNPVIVPVKILRGHTVSSEGLGVLDAAFHPLQPWILTAGADHDIHLWQDLH